MPSTSCEINFENNRMQVVYSGQIIRGVVRLTLTEEKLVCSAIVQFNGTAYNVNNGVNTNNMNFFEKKKYLIDRDNGKIFM